MNIRPNPIARANDDFMSALRTEAGKPLPAASAKPAAPQPSAAILPIALPPGALPIGEADTGGTIGIDLAKLIDGRLLIQGASGAGKSWTLRRLLEQSVNKIQQIVIDPEGEFKSLGEHFGHMSLDAAKLDSAALAIAAGRVREHRIDVILDLSEIDREQQMIAVSAFLCALIDAPREHWTPAIVAIDEAHLFAPFGGQSAASTYVRKAAIGAVTDLMSRGRKRGLAGVLATQRLARLAKSVASEVHSFLIGLNTLDLDIRRAAETIGWDARRAFDRLPMLDPGDFVAVGPAFNRSPCVLRVGGIETRHRGAAPVMSEPVKRESADAATLLDLAGLEQASARDAETRADATPPNAKAVRAFICDPAFPLAGKVYEALRPLAPDGAALADLATHLAVPMEELAAAVALLDGFAAVDIDGETRAVRLGRGMK